MPFPSILQSRFKVLDNPFEEADPAVAVGPDGRFEILWGHSWTQHILPDENYSSVHQGNPVGTNGLGSVANLDVLGDAADRNPDAAILANGARVVVFERWTAGNRQVFMRLDAKNADVSSTTGASAPSPPAM